MEKKQDFWSYLFYNKIYLNLSADFEKNKRRQMIPYNWFFLSG
jgi:hypothetical protein